MSARHLVPVVLFAATVAFAACSAIDPALRVLQAGQHAALVGRAMGRYQAPQESSGEPAPAHCGGAECFLVEATSEACGCGCPSCCVGGSGA